jgi:MFS family permease
MGLAAMIGGVVIAKVPAMELAWIGQVEPWQVVFMVVGLPGLLIALLMLTVREPRRSGLLPAAVADGAPKLSEVIHYIAARKSAYGLLIAGYSAHGLLWNGAIAWIPTFFIRHFGFSQSQIGWEFGKLLLVCGTLGVVSGGFVSNWLVTRSRSDANPLVGVLSALLVLPMGILMTQTESSQTALLFCALFVFCGAMPYGAAATAFQEITPNQMRAQVTAVYFFFLNLCGIGLGSTVVAYFTDKVFHADAAVGDSIAVVIGAAAPVAALLLWLALRPHRNAIVALPKAL